jgi:hypothetical protein
MYDHLRTISVRMWTSSQKDLMFTFVLRLLTNGRPSSSTVSYTSSPMTLSLSLSLISTIAYRTTWYTTIFVQSPCECEHQVKRTWCSHSYWDCFTNGPTSSSTVAISSPMVGFRLVNKRHQVENVILTLISPFPISNSQSSSGQILCILGILSALPASSRL